MENIILNETQKSIIEELEKNPKGTIFIDKGEGFIYNFYKLVKHGLVQFYCPKWSINTNEVDNQRLQEVRDISTIKLTNEKYHITRCLCYNVYKLTKYITKEDKGIFRDTMILRMPK